MTIACEVSVHWLRGVLLCLDRTVTSPVADSLADLLPSAADASRPWLVWYAPGERVELTGHVLHMWQCKIANLLTEEAPTADPAGLLVHLDLGVHWRTVTWCCGAWLAGGAVTFTSAHPTAAARSGDDIDGTAGAAPQPAAAPHPGTTSGAPTALAAPADVSVAFTPTGLAADAELQVLVPREPLARHWPGTLPPLVLDGVAEVMSRADAFPAQPVESTRAAIRLDPAGSAGTPTEVSRAALVAGLGELADPVDAPGTAERAPTAGAGHRAALVRARTGLEALRGVLTAWQAGQTAVLVSPDADADLVQAAARQECGEPH
ncbi:hypothetical protein SAMN05216355_101342 [Actinomyces ruminicola]|uniref:TIGR03089 family protein n=1 Tax=Actinomyces ruminicola TaxID=332524 RepID=A0A1G9ZPA3_9ACTO|nr:hypothetical protein SAMN05216355_101342 [Actinomyces ruminicola]